MVICVYLSFTEASESNFKTWVSSETRTVKKMASRPSRSVAAVVAVVVVVFVGVQVGGGVDGSVDFDQERVTRAAVFPAQQT
jgi:hypothetical protein